MKHYLWILKTTHGGADMDTCLEMAKGGLDGDPPRCHSMILYACHSMTLHACHAMILYSCHSMITAVMSCLS